MEIVFLCHTMVMMIVHMYLYTYILYSVTPLTHLQKKYKVTSTNIAIFPQNCNNKVITFFIFASDHNESSQEPHFHRHRRFPCPLGLPKPRHPEIRGYTSNSRWNSSCKILFFSPFFHCLIVYCKRKKR